MTAKASQARLTAFVWVVIVIGTGVIASSVSEANPAQLPDLSRLVVAGSLFALGEIIMFHVRYGRDRRSYTWSETALVIGLALLARPWLGLVAPLGVALAHTACRRPALKTGFNAATCAIGIFVAGSIKQSLAPAGSPLSSPQVWLALAAGSWVFFTVTTSLVSAAVSLSQDLPFGRVHVRGLALNVVVWTGNTTIGILVVAIAGSQPAMFAVFPLLLGILYLVYRSYLRAMQERDVWELLQETSRDLLTTDRDLLADVVLGRTHALFAADFVELLLADETSPSEATAFTWTAARGASRADGEVESLAAPFWGRATCERVPFELVRSKAAEIQRSDLENLGLANCLVAPLLSESSCVGVLRVGFSSRRRLTERERQVFTTFANHVSAAVQNTQLFDEIRRQALHDPLTGLPNRLLLMDRLHQALNRSQRNDMNVAVLLLDLDRFKVINDSLGHHIGDRLLLEVAGRLTAQVRPGDTATRLGGDEFAIVCEDITSPEQALAIAARMTTALERPFNLDGRLTYVSASIGVAVSHPGAVEPGVLLRDADAAMYRAKDRGRACCELFDDAMRERIVTQHEIENDLRSALDAWNLTVSYQPIVDIRANKVLGLEALVRWNHPERGAISPAEFVPLAEEAGLIHALGSGVLRDAVGAMASRSILAEGGYVSVNLSSCQLAHGEQIVAEVAALLARTGVPAARLCLEITETALIDDIDAAVDTLTKLKSLGVLIALDDFGTGYSSLSYLRRLPVDILKIDRQFVAALDREARDVAIVAGMVELAHALGLRVVAEGVETKEQLQQLGALGCDAAQGFYFAAPSQVDEVERIMAEMFDATIVPFRSQAG